jgi:hypothetical protein
MPDTTSPTASPPETNPAEHEEVQSAERAFKQVTLPRQEEDVSHESQEQGLKPGHDTNEMEAQTADEETYATTCEAPTCGGELADYDPLGNAWCKKHSATRGEIIRLGDQLKPAFPAVLSLPGYTIAEGSACWSKFVKKGEENQVACVLAAVQTLYREQERVRQARE